jgi:uncharacterized protein YeeX (DUF496 family)
MTKFDQSLEDMIVESTKQQPSPDKLEFIRDQIRSMRALHREIQDAEERVRILKSQKREMEMQILPDLFMQIGVTNIGLTAEGNEPPYEAKIEDYYHAVISAEWPEERRKAALDWIEKNKLGDLIKTVITIEFGKGTTKLVRKIEAVLSEFKVPYSKQRNIAWNTLTAAIKEMYRDGRVLGDTDLATIGAYVGKIVKLKQKKED